MYTIKYDFFMPLYINNHKYFAFDYILQICDFKLFLFLTEEIIDDYI